MREVNAVKYRPGATSTQRNLLAQQITDDDQKSLKSFKTDSKNQHHRINSLMYQQQLPFNVAQSQLDVGSEGQIQGKVGTIKV